MCRCQVRTCVPWGREGGAGRPRSRLPLWAYPGQAVNANSSKSISQSNLSLSPAGPRRLSLITLARCQEIVGDAQIPAFRRKQLAQPGQLGPESPGRATQAASRSCPRVSSSVLPSPSSVSSPDRNLSSLVPSPLTGSRSETNPPNTMEVPV